MNIAHKLHRIQDSSNLFCRYIADDPVRNHISLSHRLGKNRDIFVSTKSEHPDQPSAIVCVSYQSRVPILEEELFQTSERPNIAVYYTIWSYQPGAGRELIFRSLECIRQDYPAIERFVTLSPKTEMARKFHLRNGARIYQENTDTINYEYYTDSSG